MLGQVLIAADELEPARRRLEQASAILEKLGQGGDVAGNDVLLATVAFDERRFADAMTLGRAAAAKAEAAQSKLNEAAAWAVVASGAAGAHQTKPAADALARAEALQPKSGVDPDHALTLTLAKARVQAASGDSDAALATLRAALAAARRDGYVLHQLELRLALAELGVEDPAAVAAEARSRGLLHLARRAGLIDAPLTRPAMAAQIFCNDWRGGGNPDVAMVVTG